MRSARFVCSFAILISMLVVAQSNHDQLADQPNGMPIPQQRHPALPPNLSQMSQEAPFAQSGARAFRATEPRRRALPMQGPDFAPAQAYGSGGYQGDSVAVSDVNGDAKPDLLVANTCADSNCTRGGVGVLLGNGDGTFQSAVSYLSGGIAANSVAVGDVNGDGKPDLLVANQCASNSCANGVVSVLLGNGDGTFQAAVSYDSGGYAAWSVVVADVNGDGKPDLVIANQCASGSDSCTGLEGIVGVLLGNGDGTFQAAVSYGSGGVIAFSLAVGDVNGDGKPDLLVANQCASNSCANGSVGVLLGNGDGTFQPAVSYGSGGFQADFVALWDVNGDGKPDLVVANHCASDGNCNGSVGVLLGNGDGTFQAAVCYSSGGFAANSVAVGDVNGDGKPDLVVANRWVSNGNYNGIVGVLLGNGDGTFQAPVGYASGGQYAFSAVVGDVNRDGKPDLVVANQCASGNACNVGSGGGGSVGVLLGISAKTSTTTTITSSLNPSAFGQAVTFTATVTPASGGPPTGSVTFYDGSTAIGTSPLSGNYASLTISTLSYGTHFITAAYGGDSNFQPSTSSPLIQTVNQATTATALASSANPSYVNQKVTFTATVTSQYGGTLTGSVQFKQGSYVVTTVPLANGQAAYSVIYSTTGVRYITAVYSGDSNNQSSTSAVLRQVVNSLPTATTTTVTTSGSPSFINQPVTFTATISSAYGPIPDGETVTFYDGKTLIGTGITASGAAKFTTSVLTAMTHTIHAAYSGDATFASSSGNVTQVVNLYSTTTALSSNLNPSNYGQAVTLTVVVTTTGSATPTGTVTFKNGSTAVGTPTLDSTGTARERTTSIPVGSNTLTAVYNGDALNSDSTSAPINQTVNQAVITLTLASTPNPSQQGETVKFTATLTSNGGLPTGNVKFNYGTTQLGTAAISGGEAILYTTALPQGADQVTASYAGNAYYSAASGSVVQTVN